MRRIGNKHKTVMVSLGLLFLLSTWSGAVWADPQEQPRQGSDQVAADKKDAADPKQDQPLGEDGRGLKGFALSLGSAGDDHRLHLKTAVLVKPLRTDHFFVAFAASTPLMKNSGSSTADLYGIDYPVDGSQGGHAYRNQHALDSGSDWLVMTDWPLTNRLLPASQETGLNWMPKMGEDTAWHSKMELIFLPADQWTVRAILSMARDAPKYRQFYSNRSTHSARVGMAIDVDYQIFKSIALGFDYGHYRYGRTFMDAAGDAEISPVPSNPDGPLRSDTFTARLTIQF